MGDAESNWAEGAIAAIEPWSPVEVQTVISTVVAAWELRVERTTGDAAALIAMLSPRERQVSEGILESSRGPLTMRGVPDVAGNTDPEAGWRVRVDGKDIVIGGTSAAAPLWAALVARINSGSRRAPASVP